MTVIGPNFKHELRAHFPGGIPPMSWTADGEINYGEGVSNEDQTTVAGVLAAHDPSKPDPNAAYAALIAGGCEIVSTGTPALDGTYACDDQSRSDMQGLVLDANIIGSFPTGPTFAFPDLGGTPHTVTPAQLQSIGAALAGFVIAARAARIAALAGGVWAPPAQPVTIA